MLRSRIISRLHTNLIHYAALGVFSGKNAPRSVPNLTIVFTSSFSALEDGLQKTYHVVIDIRQFSERVLVRVYV